MTDSFDTIFDELQSVADAGKRMKLSRFFKTGIGEYGEGDVFLGITVPDVRKIAKRHGYTQSDEIRKLLLSEYHEVRLCGLLIMVLKCSRKSEQLKRDMFELYLSHTTYINNWDLVDLSAPAIVGEYLVDKPRKPLYKLSESPILWENRIAMVATMAFIRRGALDDTYRLALKLMGHKHDLIRKAAGWMLREAGMKDHKRLFDFVEEHHLEMPRTMLRYAIEKFPSEEREFLMRRY